MTKLWISWTAAALLLVGTTGCAKKPPSKSPKSDPSRGAANRATSTPKVSVKLHEYIPMSKVSGRVVAQGPGAINLAICTVKEWARCKVEKRPPIPSETVTVLFGGDHHGEFTFERSDSIVPPFFVFSTRDSEFRIDPVKVGK